jgi:hypothetical protein
LPQAARLRPSATATAQRRVGEGNFWDMAAARGGWRATDSAEVTLACLSSHFR